MRDWVSTQPKIENLEAAQDTMKRGAQTWNALPEHEKQVCALIFICSRFLSLPIAIPRESPSPEG
jgi:hypothetical protein